MKNISKFLLATAMLAAICGTMLHGSRAEATVLQGATISVPDAGAPDAPAAEVKADETKHGSDITTKDFVYFLLAFATGALAIKAIASIVGIGDINANLKKLIEIQEKQLAATERIIELTRSGR
jgi:hypothetical protein